MVEQGIQRVHSDIFANSEELDAHRNSRGCKTGCIWA